MKNSESLKAIPQERSHFQFMLAKNPNYFGNIPGSKLKPNLKLISDTSFEQLTCVGYNPDTTDMEATFSIKQSSGYSGSLCQTGSLEYVRFYLDFHDGNGFIDQGSVAVNVHDIPADKDCQGKSIFPLKYVATLKKKTNKFSNCANPVLPTLRAILSWGQDPPANSPGWQPVWGSVMNSDVQLKPIKFTFPWPIEHLDISDYLQLATDFPNLTTNQILDIAQIDINQLKPQPKPEPLMDFIKKSEKMRVPALRFAYKSVQKMVKYPTSEITMLQKETYNLAKINVSELIDKYSILFPIDTSKANVDYEELECIGLDYNTESLVATIKIKKNAGYSGDLCDPGSKEYVSFWIDWDDQCEWQYLNTVQLNVHDIQMKGDSLSYSVSLPLNATHYRKLCSQPNVVRVRGVLSWNQAPSTTDPNKLEYYGNRVDAHIQIKPGFVIQPGDVFPLFNIIGGIDVAHVSDLSGLTTPGSFFAFNGLPVPTGAPFGGVIVLNGPTFPGYRYRIKVTNLNTMASYYVNDTFTVVGFLPMAPWVQYTNQSVDADGYYHFLDPEKNTLNVLSRFTPGTEDKLLVELEVDTVAGVFSKTIQMDNTAPKITLTVNDEGDCTHYKKGDEIKGHFSVNDDYIDTWSFGTTWGGNETDHVNVSKNFSVLTNAGSHPCGNVSLSAVDKTIVNSQGVGHHVYASYNICLREK